MSVRPAHVLIGITSLIAVGILLCLRSIAVASIRPGVVVTTMKTAVAPKTADADDPAWKGALVADDFTNFTTESAAGANVATTVRLSYDDTNVYVGFVANERKVALTAQQRTDDVGFGIDDSVTFSLDTSGNGSRGYGFTATPLGTKYEFATESARYAPPWSAVATTTPDGYSVLMTIPLADMRLLAGATQRWRINFTRRVAASSDLLTWAYAPSDNGYCQQRSPNILTYCDATKWIELQGITLHGVAKVPPPHADVYALESVGRDRSVFETEPTLFTQQNVRNLGLDATVPITRTFAFVGALGPDFTNVETDQTTIAPQEFARQYNEYRPFFSEGASYLTPLPQVGIGNAGYTMFYTPSLGLVDDGYKVEGTYGNSAIGALDTNGQDFDDRAFGYRYRTQDQALSLDVQGVNADHPGIVDNTLGIGGSFVNPHSGLEPLVELSQESGTLVASPRNGRNLLVGALDNHGLFQSAFIYRDIGPNYSPVDGYTTLPDVRGPVAFAQYNGVVGGSGPIKTVVLAANGDRLVDRSGAAHEVDSQFFAQIGFKNLLSLNAQTGTSYLRFYADGGFPTYAGGRNFAFNQTGLTLNYADGTPNSADASYLAGSFAVVCRLIEPQAPCSTAPLGIAGAFTQQLDFTTTRTFKNGLAATVEYGGSIQRPYLGVADSQWLRRLTFTRAVGANGNAALSLREISGMGGFAIPGVDLAVSYQKRFANQDRLFVEYGSPGSNGTLQRVIVKYVFHIGAGGAGN